MVSNQGWSNERLQSHQQAMHIAKETDILAAKVDLLLKKFEGYSQGKAQTQTLQVLDAHMMCEVSGNTGHSGNDCLGPRRKRCF
jgi:hypothetical protein